MDFDKLFRGGDARQHDTVGGWRISETPGRMCASNRRSRTPRPISRGCTSELLEHRPRTDEVRLNLAPQSNENKDSEPGMTSQATPRYPFRWSLSAASQTYTYVPKMPRVSSTE